MSYIQIDLCGKLRGLNFNMFAIEKMRDFASVAGMTSASNIAITYCGLLGNAFVKNETLDVSLEQVCEAVEEMMMDERRINDLQRITECFVESKAYKFALGQLEKKTKEQLTGTTSTDSPSESSDLDPGNITG